jgi:hypothetical protein
VNPKSLSAEKSRNALGLVVLELDVEALLNTDLHLDAVVDLRLRLREEISTGGIGRRFATPDSNLTAHKLEGLCSGGRNRSGVEGHIILQAMERTLSSSR